MSQTNLQQPSGGEPDQYGKFSADGREYCITNPRPPRPWCNVISNPRMGLAVSQTGSGFTWLDNSQLAVITRWEQDLARDSSGKFLYIRDAGTGELWSLSPAPVWAANAVHMCRHGLGYTTFETDMCGIRTDWTLYVDPVDTIEYWRVEIRNQTSETKRLELCAFLEWNCGVSPSPRREFHKLFIETAFDAQRGAVLAWNHMWDVPAKRFGHWNADFPYVAALACSEPVLRAQGDKTAFLGRYGDFKSPAALKQEWWKPRFGRHDDAIAALQPVIELRPGQSRTLAFVIAVGSSRPSVEATLDRVISGGGEAAVGNVERALHDARAAWTTMLAAHRIDTPEPTLNYLSNDWIRYQAISGRIWGRCGYYQQSGAFGFRDQLQDSQIWLTIDSRRCRDQINLHAEHQFSDGSVYHWWHPLTEQGHITKMTDDLLWLSFVTANYLRETGDLSILADATPFLNDARPACLVEHVHRAFARVFSRISSRGLPYIGAGDWNDGLSAMGLEERGESVWMGHFLAGLLHEWSDIYSRVAKGDDALRRALRCSRESADPRALTPEEWFGQAADFRARRERLVAAINEHAWDGSWYWRATRDDGQKIGSRENRVGRIYLNAQTWAILNDVAPPDRARVCMAAVREHLVREVGSLLLAPAYDAPDERIGYITRYAPGLRENGGVYTHAATWAIAAACKIGDADLVDRLLTAIDPARKDAERYWAEPYVLPGNVDGPESPYFGRAGWTWYTGSAQWLHRIMTQCVLGVRPDWDGLHIQPCLPPSWTRAAMKRPWRGCEYEIQIERVKGVAAVEVSVDGQGLPANVVPIPTRAGQKFVVRARVG
ncbi:MAG: glycosyl transferase family 36 [Phycisphaerae bacterium]